VVNLFIKIIKQGDIMSCTTATYDICVDQGADLSLPIAVTGLSLTGASAEMDIRESVSSSSTVVELSTANGKISIAGQVITVNLTDTETALFTKQYVYDLFVTTSDTKKHKILVGKVNTNLSVTR
jgi:hypothetical protein